MADSNKIDFNNIPQRVDEGDPLWDSLLGNFRKEGMPISCDAWGFKWSRQKEGRMNPREGESVDQTFFTRSVGPIGFADAYGSTSSPGGGTVPMGQVNPMVKAQGLLTWELEAELERRKAEDDRRDALAKMNEENLSPEDKRKNAEVERELKASQRQQAEELEAVRKQETAQREGETDSDYKVRMAAVKAAELAQKEADKKAAKG